MKKFSQKGLLLFAGAMAVCAFVLPGVSSAASWSQVNSDGHLISFDFGFTSSMAGGLTTSCALTEVTTQRDNAQVLTISGAKFLNCTSRAPAVSNHCTATLTPTGFPWSATAVTTSNIQIHGVNIDVRFEHFATGATCPTLNGVQAQITGTPTGGVYNMAARTITYTNAEGLVSHPGGVVVTLRGTFSSTGLLEVLD